MTQIRIDDNNKVPGGMFDAMYVGRPKAQFGAAGSQHNPVLAVNLLQVLGHIQCSIRTAIINNNHLVFQAAAREELEIPVLRLKEAATHLAFMYFTISHIIMGKLSFSL